MNIARYRKAIAAVIGAIVQAAALGLLPHPYDKWVPVLVMAATAAGVYAVPNARTAIRVREHRV